MELVPADVVVPPPVWVGKSVVGVVDLLEFLGAGRALGRIGGNTIRVMSESLSFSLCISHAAVICYHCSLIVRTFCKRRGFVAALPWNRLRAQRLGEISSVDMWHTLDAPLTVVYWRCCLVSSVQ